MWKLSRQFKKNEKNSIFFKKALDILAENSIIGLTHERDA